MRERMKMMATESKPEPPSNGDGHAPDGSWHSGLAPPAHAAAGTALLTLAPGGGGTKAAYLRRPSRPCQLKHSGEKGSPLAHGCGTGAAGT